MRFRHRDGTLVHVGYCTNVHPAETLDGVLSQLRTFSAPIRANLGVPLLGVGLWLARSVVDELEKVGVDVLASALTDAGLEVVTLNGFPYSGFHDREVKYKVYEPDWTDQQRLQYTLDLAGILARLLPEDAVRGSISTLPLMWRTTFDDATRSKAESMVQALSRGLADIATATGREIRVAFEPEPGCIVQDATSAIQYLPRGERIGVCYDACHAAVHFDEPSTAIGDLIASGLPIVKLQASCALEAGAGEQDALRTFVEPRFLHQVRSATHAADDLPEAFESIPREQDWRVHYHVPIHADARSPLRTTRAHLAESLRVLFGGDSALTDHVEVETYTWSVLPGEFEDDIVDGVSSELSWISRELLALGTLTAESLTPACGADLTETL